MICENCRAKSNDEDYTYECPDCPYSICEKCMKKQGKKCRKCDTGRLSRK